jgi:DEAD/DEAH box helicase domain-containing protein
VQAYRGGYLPEERREIERKLASREIMGVASTNALELGIDIGSLDACIMVGYPGTVASLWQQAGRAGRGREHSAVFLVGQNTPVDQYLMAHSEYLFAQSPEHAIVDPDNPHIVAGHLQCAAHELPLHDDEAAAFGPYAADILDILGETGLTHKTDRRHYWADASYPAAATNLRNIAGPVYTIQDDTQGSRVIGTTDELSAMTQLHDHAVYLHAAETYLVSRLDMDQKVVHVERRDLDYYTQSIQMAQIRIDRKEDEATDASGTRGYGEVTVTTTIPMFKKIRFHSRDSLGYEELHMPPQTLETVAFWIAPSVQAAQRIAAEGHVVAEALLGVANVLVDVAPMFVMCDPSDIGATVDAACLGADALFVYDKFPGGLGYGRRCRDRMDAILDTNGAVIRECRCEDGCPSCVGSSTPAYAMGDLDSVARGRILSKAAARALMDAWRPAPG